jgi:hypothetical protein
MNGEIGDTSAKQFGNPAPRHVSDANKKYLGLSKSQVDYAKFLAVLLHSISDYLATPLRSKQSFNPALPFYDPMEHF